MLGLEPSALRRVGSSPTLGNYIASIDFLECISIVAATNTIRGSSAGRARDC